MRCTISAQHSIALQVHTKIGNFKGLDKLAQVGSDLAKHFEKQINCTSPDVQNEITKLVPKKLMPAKFYPVVID